jgi:hypothetical protein
MQRDGTIEAAARARIDAQGCLALKAALIRDVRGFVFTNDASVEELQRHVH